MMPRGARLSLALFGLAALAGACATTVNVGSERPAADAAAPPPAFAPPDSDAGDAAQLPRVLACMGTECSFPYATCLDKPSFKCGTNLLTDPKNCGACGVECAGFDGINMTASCAAGKCAFECQTKEIGLGNVFAFKNCNGLLDDGCEVDVNADPKNCGVCGNVCPSGVRCINGRCGCPSGETDCNGRCRNLLSDDSSCGECGRSCSANPAEGCNPRPPNTRYGCGNGTCGALKCTSGFGDCNRDLGIAGCASDGCETNLKTDPRNCGGCGLACGADQECRDDGAGPQCLDKCEKLGLTKCSSGCKDLLSDRLACGSCNINCGNPRANQVVSCQKGLCQVDCLPGFADCNGDPQDGCEVDLMVHPANCGACGKACDFGAGQPCITGKCLMVECEAGVSR